MLLCFCFAASHYWYAAILMTVTIFAPLLLLFRTLFLLTFMIVTSLVKGDLQVTYIVFVGYLLMLEATNLPIVAIYNG